MTPSAFSFRSNISKPCAAWTTERPISSDLKPVYDTFVVVDYFKSGMSEYDAKCIFIPLEHLQTLRGMDNRATNILRSEARLRYVRRGRLLQVRHERV